MASQQNAPQRIPIVVLGVGNAYRGDDGIGPTVAQRLREEPPDHVVVLTASGEGTSLLESWRNTDAAILIDAVHSAARPGTVHRIEAAEQPVPKEFLRCSTHSFGVAEAIELARVLQQLPSRLIVYGIVGKTFEAGAGLSTPLTQAVPHVVARVRRDICALKAERE